MPLHFITTSQASVSSGVKCLIYGGPGMGKTMLIATAPRPLVISAEAGLLSLRPRNIARVYGENNPSITYDIPGLEIRTVEDLSDAYQFCATSVDMQRFDTICLDSLSEIGETVLNNAKKQVKDPRQAYGELIEKMETLVRWFRDIPGKHVYMSAKMEPIKDDMTGAVRYGPSMPGRQLGPALPYFFDEVFHLGVNKTPQGEEFRYLQTQPDLQYEAKDRSGALDPLEYPSLTNVFYKILND